MLPACRAEPEPQIPLLVLCPQALGWHRHSAPSCLPQPGKHGWLVLQLSTSSVKHLRNPSQTEVRLAAEDGVAVNLFFSAQQFPLRSPSTNRCSVSHCPASAPRPGSCVCPQAGPEGRVATHGHSEQQPGAGSALSLAPIGAAGIQSGAPRVPSAPWAGTHTWLPVSSGLLHFIRGHNFIFSAGLPPLQ